MTRPTRNELISRARRILTDGLPLRRHVEGGLALLIAGAAHGLHGRIAWVVRQSMPDSATGGQLRKWARARFVEPEAGAKASGFAQFTATGVVSMPVGTRVRDELGHMYEVTESTGPYSGAVYVPIEAQAVGSAQNLAEGEPVFLVDPVAGVDSEGQVGPNPFDGSSPSEVAGGLDPDTDRALRTRLLERMASAGHGGAPGDYERLAHEGGAELAWESVETSGPGIVDVYVMKMDPDGYNLATGLGAEELAAVRSHVLDHCPITVDVRVSVPGVTPVVVGASITPDTSETRAQVVDELRALFLRELEQGATVPLSRISEAIQLAPDVTSHTLTAPASAPTAITGNVLQLSTVNFS